MVQFVICAFRGLSCRSELFQDVLLEERLKALHEQVLNMIPSKVQCYLVSIMHISTVSGAWVCFSACKFVRVFIRICICNIVLFLLHFYFIFTSLILICN